MLKLILKNPMDYLINNYKNYDAIIFPDYIIKRNFEISLISKNIEKIPENMYTIYTLAKELTGKNLRLLPRFLERELAHFSLDDANYYRDLHSNEHFVTDVLWEYWEIKENSVETKKIIKDKSRFFDIFDKNFSSYLEKFKDGINIENSIVYIYPREEILNLIKENLNDKFKKFLFCCFYYISPTLKRFIEELRNDHEISILVEPMPQESAELLLKRLDPDDLEKDEIPIPEEFLLESLPDQRREVKFIANYIIEKTYEGHSFSEFIIAFPDVKEYEQYITEIFDQYSLPYFIETKTRLVELPVSSIFLDKLKNIEFKDLDDFINRCNIELKNLQEGNFLSEYLKGTGKLVFAIHEFRNEMMIIEKLFGKNLDFLQSFESFLSIYNFGSNLENLNSVRITDLSNLPLKQAEFIIVGGLNENKFPKPYYNKIIFPEIFNSNSIYYRNGEIHEKYELYILSAAFSYGKRFLFTYPYLDIEGKRYLESYFLKKLEKELKINIKRKNESASSLIYGDILFNKKDIGISKALVGKIQNSKEFEIKCDERLKELLSNMEITPTHITSYHSCPRKFYFRYILNLEISVKPFSPVHMGIIVHDVLKKFYEKYVDLSELHNLIEKKEIYIKKEVNEIINLLKMDDKMREEFDIHLETIKRYVMKAIKNDLDIDQSRKVIAREKEFTFEISGKFIKGRIDRMDRMNNSYVLIDYKYSSPSHVRSLFIQDEKDLEKPEKDLNLPIYILWLEKNYSPDSFVAFYFPIRSRLKKHKKWLFLYTKNFRAPSQGWTNYLKNTIWNDTFKKIIEARISKIIQDINECKFPMTENENTCQQCEFKYICRGDVQ
ncbi:MAG: PD-(D/E)XK nuclease family protein [Thermoplasmata archaeon]